MEAIVLNKHDFREVDQIVSLYTKDRGKIDVLARGVKKITSKNMAHLEPFSHIFVDLVGGKEFDQLTKVVPINIFSNIRQNLEKVISAEFVVNFFEKLTESGSADLQTWKLVSSWFYFVDKTKKFNSILVDAFILQLFGVLGMAPVLDRCVVSGVSFQEMLKDAFVPGHRPLPGFYFAGGGLVSPKVREEKIFLGESVVRCGLKEISSMQGLLKSSWQIIADFNLPENEKKVLHNLIYDFAIYHSNKKFSDWEKILQFVK